MFWLFGNSITKKTKIKLFKNV